MFTINGLDWNLEFVSNESSLLCRSNGSRTIGMTDSETQTIYIAEGLSSTMLRKVLVHELCHAYCVSYGVYLPIEYEEKLCDAIATYGKSILSLSDCIIENLNKYYQ